MHAVGGDVWVGGAAVELTTSGGCVEKQEGKMEGGRMDEEEGKMEGGWMDDSSGGMEMGSRFGMG